MPDETAQTIVTETNKPAVTDPSTPAKTPDPSTSDRMNAIAKRDKMALMRMRAAQAKEAELIKREAAAKELEAKYSKKPANPIESLVRDGWSYKDATDFVLNESKLTPEIEVKKVRSELEEFKAQQLDDQRKKDEASLLAAKAQEQEVIANFQNEIGDFIEANAGDYELIKEHDQQPLVFATINEHFERTKAAGKPKIMSFKEAADLVEQHLYEKIEATISKAKKFKDKYAPAKSNEEKDPLAMTSKTLTNAMTSSAASTLPAKTEQERIQRALAKLAG